MSQKKFTPYALTALPAVQDRDKNGLYFIRTPNGMNVYLISELDSSAIPLEVPPATLQYLLDNWSSSEPTNENLVMVKCDFDGLINPANVKGLFLVRHESEDKFQLYKKEESGDIVEVRANNCFYNYVWSEMISGSGTIPLFKDNYITFLPSDQDEGKSYRGEIYFSFTWGFGAGTTFDLKGSFGSYTNKLISSLTSASFNIFGSGTYRSANVKIEYHLDFYGSTVCMMTYQITVYRPDGAISVNMNTFLFLMDTTVENNFELWIEGTHAGATRYKHQLMVQRNQTIETPITCEIPVINRVSPAKRGFILFEWSHGSGVQSYEVRYRFNGGAWNYDTTTDDEYVTADSPVPVELQVRRNCGGSGYSGWSTSEFWYGNS